MNEWGYPHDYFEIYQDNVSSIIKSHQGHKAYSKMKHMNRRFYNIKEHLDNGTVKMPHCSTTCMISDCLSKATTTKNNAIKQFRQISGLEEINMESTLTAKEEIIIANLCSFDTIEKNSTDNWDELLNEENEF